MDLRLSGRVAAGCARGVARLAAAASGHVADGAAGRIREGPGAPGACDSPAPWSGAVLSIRAPRDGLSCVESRSLAAGWFLLLGRHLAHRSGLPPASAGPGPCVGDGEMRPLGRPSAGLAVRDD